MGKGVHVVTVNDYLASREMQMNCEPLYEFLGLSVGAIIDGIRDDDQRKTVLL